MTGSSIFDYIHHQDHSEVAEHLGLGLANGQGLSSPSSGASDEGGGNQGTNNPDGKIHILLNKKTLFLKKKKLVTRVDKFSEKMEL